MKYFYTALSIFVITLSFGQSDYNKWSVSAAIGGHDALIPSPAQTRLLQLHHYDVNVRYMFNNRVGLMLDGGYDFLDFYDFPRNSQYIRTSIQGVINLRDVLRFESFTKHLGLLIHGGPGGSFLSQKDANGERISDRMLTMTAGITPQVKLNEKWSLKGDITGMLHNKQNNAYDFSRRTSDRFINGALLNISLGVTYYIGKHATHADWTPTVYGGGNAAKEAALEKKIADLENQLKDDDADGVPNFRDKEPNSKTGVIVNSLGEEIIPVKAPADTDGDGFTDNVDECPTVAGKLNGCPDRDGDGVPDYRDACPNEFGLIEHNGCALSKTTLEIIQKASESIFFDTGKDKIKQSSFTELDKIAQIMKDNPTVNVLVEGHTDNVGGDAKNLQLSKDRAAAVRNFLISKGVNTNRLSSEGFGAAKPIADNNTEVGRAQNRRVVITTSTFTEKIKVEEGK